MDSGFATSSRPGMTLSPLKHRLALVDKGLHRLLVIRGHGGADQAFGFVVAGGGKMGSFSFRNDMSR